MKSKPRSTKDDQSRNSSKLSTSAKASITKQSENSGDIIQLILRDHIPLKKFIVILKNVEIDRKEKQGSLEEFIPMLMSHAKAEEQSLYAEMKDLIQLRLQGFEGDTEHAISEQLIQEINATPDDFEWSAKVKVLAELVEHHIKEEEDVILKHVASEMPLADRNAVGKVYVESKTEIDVLSHPRKYTLNSRDRAAQLRRTRTNREGYA